MRNKKIVYSLFALSAMTTGIMGLAMKNSGIHLNLFENKVQAADQIVYSSGNTEFNTTVGPLQRVPIDPNDGSKFQGGATPGESGAKVVVDPNNNGEITNTIAGLSLDQVPTNISFGTHAVNVVTGSTYSSEPLTGSEVNNNMYAIQTSDYRGGKDVWSLTAQLSDFTSEDGKKLDGVSIRFKKPTTAPTKGTIYDSGDSWRAPLMIDASVPAGGDPVMVIDGSDNLTVAGYQGKGNWKQLYKNDEIQIVIPQTVQRSEDTFKATITWTMADTLPSS